MGARVNVTVRGRLRGKRYAVSGSMPRRPRRGRGLQPTPSRCARRSSGADLGPLPGAPEETRLHLCKAIRGGVLSPRWSVEPMDILHVVGAGRPSAGVPVTLAMRRRGRLPSRTAHPPASLGPGGRRQPCQTGVQGDVVPLKGWRHGQATSRTTVPRVDRGAPYCGRLRRTAGRHGAT